VIARTPRARDGLGISEDVLTRQFRLNLHRAIAYLVSPNTIRSVADLVPLGVEADLVSGGAGR
jgi:hypothetical protein